MISKSRLLAINLDSTKTRGSLRYIAIVAQHTFHGTHQFFNQTLVTFVHNIRQIWATSAGAEVERGSAPF